MKYTNKPLSQNFYAYQFSTTPNIKQQDVLCEVFLEKCREDMLKYGEERSIDEKFEFVANLC